MLRAEAGALRQQNTEFGFAYGRKVNQHGWIELGNIGSYCGANRDCKDNRVREQLLTQLLVEDAGVMSIPIEVHAMLLERRLPLFSGSKTFRDPASWYITVRVCTRCGSAEHVCPIAF